MRGGITTTSVVYLPRTIKGDDSSMPTQFHHIIAVHHFMKPLWIIGLCVWSVIAAIGASIMTNAAWVTVSSVALLLLCRCLSDTYWQHLSIPPPLSWQIWIMVWFRDLAAMVVELQLCFYFLALSLPACLNGTLVKSLANSCFGTSS